MATFTATQVAGKPWVRLELNWSDTPDVEYVKIIRLLPGQTYSTALNAGGTAIRLPTWGNTFTNTRGTWTYLSAGRGIWYDTEAPMDVAVTWLAVADVYASAARDTFTRSVSNNWGTADLGGTWVVTAAATQWQVTGTLGTSQPSAVTSDRFATLTLSGADRTVEMDLRVPALPASGTLRMGISARYTDASNHYIAEMVISTAGLVTLRIIKRVATVETVIASGVSPFLYVGATWWRLRFMAAGTRLAAKVWPVFDVSEPVGWQLDTTDTSLAAGTLVAAFFRNESAVTTHVYSADNLRAYANAQSALTLATSGSVTMASAGVLWLTDPLRPGNDRALNLCPSGSSGCTQPSGIFFRDMDGFGRRADQNVIDIEGRVRPVVLSQVRKAPTSQLAVVSRTLVDRDDVLALTAPGTPLLLRAPAVYGYPDRYLAIADTREDRVTTDHRVPIRSWSLPWAEADEPVGASQGVPETRFDDLCTNYASWTALVAAGHTWEDIMQGDAA